MQNLKPTYTGSKVQMLISALHDLFLCSSGNNPANADSMVTMQTLTKTHTHKQKQTYTGADTDTENARLELEPGFFFPLREQCCSVDRKLITT